MSPQDAMVGDDVVGEFGTRGLDRHVLLTTRVISSVLGIGMVLLYCEARGSRWDGGAVSIRGMTRCKCEGRGRMGGLHAREDLQAASG